MPVKFALTCAQCDAPLPTPTSATGTFRCAHCGATTAFTLSAEEVALFRGGLHAEEGANGAFTLSGVGAMLSAQLETLSAKVDESVSLTRRLQLPQLRQTLHEQRAARASREQEVTQLLEQIEQRRVKATGRRPILWIVVGLMLLSGLSTGDNGLLGLALLCAAILVFAGYRSNAKWKQMAVDLLDETQPEISEMARAIAETEQLIHDIERHLMSGTSHR